jgi:VWFA-related protein
VEKSDFPTIKLYLDVADTAGQPLEGLQRPDFQVFEDGQLEEIISFADPNTPRPLTTVLVLDHSGSMEQAGKIGGLKAAASTYVQSMKEDDQIGIVAFSNEVQEIQPLTSRRDLLYGALESLQANGTTAFYDAVYDGVRVAGRVRGRRIVLAMTDGLDNQSWKSLEGVVNLARRYGVPVYTIGLGARAKGTGGEEGINEEALLDLANQTGGLYFYAPSVGELVGIYELLSRRFQAGYEVVYASPRQVEDGTTRAVSVIVTAQAESVQAVNSYYVPGVIVPSANTTLFISFLIPLVLLAVSPSLLRGIGLLRLSLPGGWAGGVLQKGRVIFTRKTGPHHAEDDSLYLVPLTNGAALKPFRLKRGDNLIGSDRNNDLIISHPSVSPQHARIKWEDNRYIAYDLGSTTGTFVSYTGDISTERQIGKSALKTGSRLRFGNVFFSLSERSS